MCGCGVDVRRSGQIRLVPGLRHQRVQSARVSQRGVFGPRPAGELVFLHLDFDKAGAAKEVSEKMGAGVDAADCSHAFAHEGEGTGAGAVRRDRVVVRLWIPANLGECDLAVGSSAAERALVRREAEVTIGREDIGRSRGGGRSSWEGLRRVKWALNES